MKSQGRRRSKVGGGALVEQSRSNHVPNYREARCCGHIVCCLLKCPRGGGYPGACCHGNCPNLSGYHYELALCLAGVVPVPALHQLEKELTTSLETLPSLSRSRGCSSFNYLLLDPRAIDGMSADDSESGCFLKFVEGVFYIGKGKNTRPLQHLLDARKALQLKDKKHVRKNAFHVGDMQGLVQVTCMSLSVLSAAPFRQVCPYPLHLGQCPWGGLPALLPLHLIRRSTRARSLHAGCCR